MKLVEKRETERIPLLVVYTPEDCLRVLTVENPVFSADQAIGINESFAALSYYGLNVKIQLQSTSLDLVIYANILK